jgi:uncharacterized membrane protein
MPETTFAGHPLHPQLVAFPIGLLPYSLVMDFMHLATGKDCYKESAHHCMMGGFVSGLAAGAAGFADYLTMPPKDKATKTATLHGSLNAGVLALYGLNLFLRRGRRETGALPVLLSLLGTAGLVVSQWYGGELVYEMGMRVKPLEKGPKADEWKLPGDERIEEAFQALE